MIDKTINSVAEAVSEIGDGAVVFIIGFGESGNLTELTHALIEQGARDLTLVNNNAGNGHVGLAALLETGQARKIICWFLGSSHSEVFDAMYIEGRIEPEVVPQGTLAERIRAAGAGIGGFYTRTSVGTSLAGGKDYRIFNGKEYVPEDPLHADFAVIKADLADRWGNLTYWLAARNFGVIMCTAAETTIIQVSRIVELGDILPVEMVAPGIFVDRVVEVASPISEGELIAQGIRYSEGELK